MDTTGNTIYTLTAFCSSKFEEAITQDASLHAKILESRLADFNLWVDSVGALAKPGASLDSRLSGRKDDIALVKNVLTMLKDSLDYYMELAKDYFPSQISIQNLDIAIENLASIGVAIRRTGKASRRRRADREFNPHDHQDLQKHLEYVILLRPREKGLFDSNNNVVDEPSASKLSKLQTRLVEANLIRRHSFVLAQKRVLILKGNVKQVSTIEVPSSFVTDELENKHPDVIQTVAVPPDSNPCPPVKDKIERMARESPRASTATGKLRYSPVTEGYSPSKTKTQITFIASNIQFPQAPSISQDRKIWNCPCCCQSMPVETFMKPHIWKQHIIEDLQPYTCVAENCPTPRVLFSTRKQWETHVRTSHLPCWECPFCEEQNTEFMTMETIVNHLQADHKYELLGRSLSTVLSWCAIDKMGIKSCPLCDFGKTEDLPEDSPDLIDHVLSHTYDFALRALPWPKTIVYDLNIPPGRDPPTEQTEYIQDWIANLVHAGVESPKLHLTDFDNADHADPDHLEPSEYSDYFLNNIYFKEEADEFSRTQGNFTSVALLNSPSGSVKSQRRLSPVTKPRSRVYRMSLYDRISRKLEKSTFDLRFAGLHTNFLPEGEIDHLITEECIKRQFYKKDSKRRDNDELVEFTLKDSKIVFAITVYIGIRGKELREGMQRFQDQGISDKSLPLNLNSWGNPNKGPDEDRSEDNDSFYDDESSHSANSDNYNINGWNNLTIKNFCRDQWVFLAPVFDLRKSDHRFPSDCILPFIENHIVEGSGTFGVVTKRKIHPAHILNGDEINSLGPQFVVVKAFKDAKDWGHKSTHKRWEQEAFTLKSLNTRSQEHILQFYTAFQRGDHEHYLMLEWADGGNLRNFWDTFPRPQLTRSLVKWVLKQIKGLAEALRNAHYPISGNPVRHGDLKPENILWFKGLERDNIGTLKIGDWGMAKEHSDDTELRHDNTTTEFVTRRYEAPEEMTGAVGARRSRLYDIWSMGCVTMEFLVWLMYGSDALKSFNKCIVTDFLHVTQFYEVTKDSDSKMVASVHHAVVYWMDHMQKDESCQPGQTALGCLLEVIRDCLLVVDLPKHMGAHLVSSQILDLSTRDHTNVLGVDDAPEPINISSIPSDGPIIPAIVVEPDSVTMQPEPELNITNEPFLKTLVRTGLWSDRRAGRERILANELSFLMDEIANRSDDGYWFSGNPHPTPPDLTKLATQRNSSVNDNNSFTVQLAMATTTSGSIKY